MRRSTIHQPPVTDRAEGVSNHPAARTSRVPSEIDIGELQQPRLPIECSAAGRR